MRQVEAKNEHDYVKKLTIFTPFLGTIDPKPQRPTALTEEVGTDVSAPAVSGDRGAARPGEATLGAQGADGREGMV